MKDIEEILTILSKPAVPELRHQEKVLDEIIKAKDKMAVSWWWSAIPVYITLCFLMKAIFDPRTTFILELTAFIKQHAIMGLILFMLLPALCMGINFYSIRRIYLFNSRSWRLMRLRPVALNILLFLLSLAILVIFLLIKMKSV